MCTIFINYFESELFHRDGPFEKMFLLLRHEINVIHIQNYFESEWFYRDEPFIKNVSFGGARKKCYVFKICEQSL